MKRLQPDEGAVIDPAWRPYPCSTENSCRTCRGQGYVLAAYPNPLASLPNYRAVPCPDCRPLV